VAETHGGFYDCYVLVSDRSPEVVRGFLDRFLPAREETAAEYEVPHHATTPTHLFRSAADLLEHLATHVHEAHAVYWRAAIDSTVAHAMVFPTSDGATILGLSCRPDVSVAERLLRDMMVFLASDIGTFWYETVAPSTAVDFAREVATHPRGTHVAR
jgi:hypothetical protein